MPQTNFVHHFVQSVISLSDVGVADAELHMTLGVLDHRPDLSKGFV